MPDIRRRIASLIKIPILCLAVISLIFTVSGCTPVAFAPQPSQQTETGGSYDVTDFKGNIVHFNHKPKRILCLSSTFDPILLGIVSPSRIAAVNYLSRDPDFSCGAEDARQVETTVREYNEETLVRLKPDLVIASSWDSPDTIQLCREFGFPVIICEGPVTFDGIENAIRLIAAAAGEKEAGENVIVQMNQKLQAADAVLSKRTDAVPSGMLVSQMTSYGGVGSMYDTLCTRARITNAITKAGVKNGEYLSKESIVLADPDFFIISAYSNDSFGYGTYKDEFLSDPALQHLHGLQQVRTVNSRCVYCANQNCGYAVMGLANCAYGEIFNLSGERLIKGY